MTYFPALPYAPHKAALHFAEVCFKFVQTTVFILLSCLPCYIINRSQTFINAYKLYFIFSQSFFIVLENVELVPVLYSFFCYILRFLEN